LVDSYSSLFLSYFQRREQTGLGPETKMQETLRIRNLVREVIARAERLDSESGRLRLMESTGGKPSAPAP
jgi:hypothetical protein